MPDRQDDAPGDASRTGLGHGEILRACRRVPMDDRSANDDGRNDATGPSRASVVTSVEQVSGCTDMNAGMSIRIGLDKVEGD